MKNRKHTAGRRSLEEWERLVERYFDAATTDEEERALRRFLASPAGADARFDEVRAVMGFLATGRSLHRAAGETPSSAAPPAGIRLSRMVVKSPLRLAAAAAVVAICLSAALSVWHWKTENVCVAYAGGRKITDRELVEGRAQASLRAVNRPTDVPEMEKQLGDMFNTLSLPEDTATAR